MTTADLLKALRRQKVMDSLRCLGCGYEHNCGIHGCAINLEAAALIEKLTAREEAAK